MIPRYLSMSLAMTVSSYWTEIASVHSKLTSTVCTGLWIKMSLNTAGSRDSDKLLKRF